MADLWVNDPDRIRHNSDQLLQSYLDCVKISLNNEKMQDAIGLLSQWESVTAILNALTIDCERMERMEEERVPSAPCTCGGGLCGCPQLG